MIPDVQVTVVPFVDAEEAWFWFMHSQRSRLEGGSFHDAGGAVARPCDPDDIYRAVMGLVRRRLIGQTHLKVLAHFGYIDCPPDNRIREQARAHDLWSEALDRLTTVLKGKGIVDVE
ncbi:MAG TPA: hypothetical protein ENI69_11555 [Rhodospirillales bacterium]|nr:hypothetical protein [Rhodospirillales bacterium]